MKQRKNLNKIILKFNTLSKNIPLKIKRVLNDKGISINRIENNEVLSKAKTFDNTNNTRKNRSMILFLDIKVHRLN